MNSTAVIRLFFALAYLSVAAGVEAHPDDGYWDAVFGAAGANTRVHALYVDGDDLYVGGDFTEIGGIEARRIARWDGANWYAFGDGIGLADAWEYPQATVSAIVVNGGVLYVGGQFQQSNGIQYNHVARWTGSQWVPVGGGVADIVFIPTIQAMTTFNGDVYICGGFEYAGGKRVNNVARWDGSGWHALDGGLTSWDHAAATAMAADDQYLYVVGYFTQAGEVPARDLALWDGNGWSAPDVPLRNEYRDIEVVDGRLYVAGWFTLPGADGVVNNVGMWDGQRWFSLDGGTNDRVMSISAVGGDLYATGNFTRAGDQSINRVAVWDGADWRGLGSSLDLRGWMFAVAARDNGEVFVGGDHDAAGGTPSPRIARWFNPVPYPARPFPKNGGTNQLTDIQLGWNTSGAPGQPDTWDVYFGSIPDPPLVATGLESAAYTPDTLYTNTQYYWKVVARTHAGEYATGSLWTFQTEDLVTSRLVVSSASGRCGAASDTVTIDVDIEDADAAIDAAGVDIQYDPSALTFLYGEPGDLTQAWQYFEGADLGTSIRVGGFDTTPIPAGSYGTFARLHFLADCCGADSTVTYALTPVDLTDDLAGLRGVPGEYTCEFFEPDGDVNGDGYLTSGDAFCTFDSYLSYPVPLPNDCGSSGWEVRGDVDCSGDITPGDALCIYYNWLDGSCQFCSGNSPTGIRSAAQSPATVSVREMRYSQYTVDVVIAVSGAPALGAFGFEIGYTPDALEYVGVMRAAPLMVFEQFGATVAGTDRIRVGGFHADPLDATDGTDLMTVRFNVLDPGRPGSVEIDSYVDDLAGAAPVHNDVTGARDHTPGYDRYVLHQNHPNPFNPDTEIRYEVPDHAGNARVTLVIYDVGGRRVKRLEDRERSPGSYNIRWNGLNEAGESVSSGVYFYVLRAGSVVLSRKLVLLR